MWCSVDSAVSPKTLYCFFAVLLAVKVVLIVKRKMVYKDG